MTQDGPDPSYEVEDLLTAFDGLQKATRSEDIFLLVDPVVTSMWMVPNGSWSCRVLDTHHKQQREGYDSQLESLQFKVEHVQNENNQLQKLFNEKSNITDSIRQEVARLNTENMVGRSLAVYRGLRLVGRVLWFLTPLIHRYCLSWSSRCQSYWDRNRNWKSIWRSRPGSWQVPAAVFFISSPVYPAWLDCILDKLPILLPIRRNGGDFKSASEEDWRGRLPSQVHLVI